MPKAVLVWTVTALHSRALTQTCMPANANTKVSEKSMQFLIIAGAAPALEDMQALNAGR